MADEPVPAGVVGEGLIYIVVDGAEIELTPEQVTSIQWSINGNNLIFCGAGEFTATAGTTTAPNLTAYPLTCAGIPAIFNQPLMLGTLAATGTCTLPPGTFDTSSEFSIQTIGQCAYDQVFFGTPVLTEVDDLQVFMLADQPEDPQNEGYTATFTLTVDNGQTGELAVIQLVNVTITLTDPNGNVSTETTTEGKFWYDGAFYPYNGAQVEVSGPGSYKYEFFDSPSCKMLKALAGYTLNASWSFFTYPVFTNASQNSIPCLIGSPVYWGFSGTLNCTNAGWQLEDSSVINPMQPGLGILPVWQNNIPESELLPLLQIQNASRYPRVGRWHKNPIVARSVSMRV